HQALAMKQGAAFVPELPAPRASQTVRAMADVKQATRTDRFGDPLPPRALMRMGTVRFRHGGTVTEIAISPSGQNLASASEDGTLRLWEVATGKELRRLRASGPPIFSVSFSHDGRLLVATVSQYEGICVWDVNTGNELYRRQNPRSWYGRSRLSPD